MAILKQKTCEEIINVFHEEVCEFCQHYDGWHCEKKHRIKEYAMADGRNETCHLRYERKRCPNWTRYVPTAEDIKASAAEIDYQVSHWLSS